MNFKDITNHEAACKVLEKDPAQSTTTDQKITDVCNAINKLSGFKPDFNSNQRKWRPYFWMDSSGFRFDHSYFVASYSYSDVGSRLCHYVGSEQEADHLGTQFLELHKQHYFGE